CAERHHLVRSGITVGTHAQEIAQLMFYEDLERVVLAGTSSGGMVICKAAELARDRIARLAFVDALALMPGERVGDIVKRASANETTSITTGPTRSDVEKRLFADLDPDLRAWALARYTPHPGASSGRRTNPSSTRRGKGACSGSPARAGCRGSSTSTRAVTRSSGWRLSTTWARATTSAGSIATSACSSRRA